MVTRHDPDLVQSFAPLKAHDASILILGSMPGIESLRQGRYYAHPRNAFWPINAVIFGFDALADYELRLAALRANGVALWDVLQSCVRPGSLDADIDARTMVPNDFLNFFASHPKVERVCFNGAKAAHIYRQCVLPGLSDASKALQYVTLPSTSPAHAAMTVAAKLQAWRTGLGR